MRFYIIILLLLLGSSAFAQSLQLKERMNPAMGADTNNWTFATSSDRLMNPEGDSVLTVSAAKWMIDDIAHPDSVLPDSMIVLRLRLMSYLTLSRYATPKILPYFLTGVSDTQKGVRNASMTGNPCSYSPRDAAWNQMVLSEAAILDAIELKTSFRPSMKSFILGLNNATSFRKNPVMPTSMS